MENFQFRFVQAESMAGKSREDSSGAQLVKPINVKRRPDDFNLRLLCFSAKH